MKIFLQTPLFPPICYYTLCEPWPPVAPTECCTISPTPAGGEQRRGRRRRRRRAAAQAEGEAAHPQAGAGGQARHRRYRTHNTYTTLLFRSDTIMSSTQAERTAWEYVDIPPTKTSGPFHCLSQSQGIGLRDSG